ncbi:ephrin-A1 [Bos mutus]|uniref:ephrin-A1 n=1 Tax=Bos mutus TaxID=72004 RepID=UPI0038B5A98C
MRSLLPHATAPGTQTHKASRGPTSEQTQRRADLPSRGARSAPLPLPSLPPPPQPPSPGQPRAGRGGGGAGCRAAPAQKAESRGGGARAASAVLTALPRNPAGIQTRRTPSSPPGLARPRAMEFFWASLLGLCCSLAAANRHTVFWNSSNPKFWNEDYTVHVRIDDYLDIICPHYEDNSVPDAAMEQYTLYLVEHEQYQLCQPQPKDHARWFCKSPKAKHGPEKLSEKFHRFTGFTLSKDFKEGHSYYYISKPIHHQEDRCLRLKVMIAGKITHSPQAHPNAQEKRLPADDPEVQVLHSIGHSAAPRLFPLAWAVLLLPFLLLQIP